MNPSSLGLLQLCHYKPPHTTAATFDECYFCMNCVRAVSPGRVLDFGFCEDGNVFLRCSVTGDPPGGANTLKKTSVQ